MTGKLLRRGLLWSIVGAAGLQFGAAAVAEPAATKAGPTKFGHASVKEAAKPTADSRIVAMLHNLNQTEIRAGKLAEKQGDIKMTREFGAALVHDHAAADKKVLAYAKEHNFPPAELPEANVPAATRHRQALDRLGMLSGANFDRQFAMTMQDGHANAIDMVGKARAGVTDPALRSLLSGLQPTLEKHFDMAKKLAAHYAPNPTFTRPPAGSS